MIASAGIWRILSVDGYVANCLVDALNHVVRKLDSDGANVVCDLFGPRCADDGR